MKSINSPVTSGSLVSDFIKKALIIKYLYIICFAIFIIAAFIINKYSNNVYEVQASILLSKNKFRSK